MYQNVCKILLGILLGILYYYSMKDSLPKENNCSFIANKTTDILAFIAGAIVSYYGIIYENTVLLIIGVCIITEHILQLEYKLK